MAASVDLGRLRARAQEIAKQEGERLLARTPESARLYERATGSLPLGVASSFQVIEPYPTYLERGAGSRVWDVDGAEYVDFHGGFGVGVVGHAHPKIVEAVDRAVRSGTHFAVTTPTTVALAEELCRRFRLDQVRFSNSGTEATMDAIRLARGATGRPGVLKVEGSYHGHHDTVMFSVVPNADALGLRSSVSGEPVSGGGAAYRTIPFSRGIPPDVAEHTLVVPFNDADALERTLAEQGENIAAFILEPVMMNVGLVPPAPGYLERVRELCTRYGVVLIFDEVKSGATIAEGGAIERYGVRPDLACFAKATGGGTPIGAFGGRADLMGEIAHGVAHLGTFNGNPLSASAGLAALTEVLTADAYRHLGSLGTLLAEGCRTAVEGAGLPAHVQDLGAKGCVSYRPEPLRSYRDYLECETVLFEASFPWMINRGVFMTPGDEEQWTLSVQHTADDVAVYLDAFAEFCTELTR